MQIRYIRDWQNGRAVNGALGYNCDWREIKAIDYFGNNIALNKTVNFSHQMNGNSSSVVDNNFSSLVWTNVNPGTKKSCTVDLGSVYDIDKLVIARASQPAICKETKTEVSADNIVWYTIFDSTTSGTYQETETGKEFKLPFQKLDVNSSLKDVIDRFDIHANIYESQKAELKKILKSKDVNALDTDNLSELITKFNNEIIDRGGARTITPTVSNQVLNKGLYKGNITVRGDSFLIPSNIKKGVTIFGVTGQLTHLERKIYEDGEIYLPLYKGFENGATANLNENQYNYISLYGNHKRLRAGVRTSSKIDLSDYDFIEFKYRVIGYDSLSFNFMGVSDSSSLLGNLSRIAYEQFSEQEEDTYTVYVNIKSLKSSYYIMFISYANDVQLTSIKLTTRQI